MDELENMSKDEKEVTETDPIRDLEEKLVFFKTSMLHMKHEIKLLYDEKNSLEKEKQDLTIKANMQAKEIEDLKRCIKNKDETINNLNIDKGFEENSDDTIKEVREL